VSTYYPLAAHAGTYSPLLLALPRCLESQNRAESPFCGRRSWLSVSLGGGSLLSFLSCRLYHTCPDDDGCSLRSLFLGSIKAGVLTDGIPPSLFFLHPHPLPSSRSRVWTALPHWKRSALDFVVCFSFLALSCPPLSWRREASELPVGVEPGPP